jgi:hypothetical protein
VTTASDYRDVGALLSVALAARIAPLVPPGIQVRSEGGTLWASDGTRSSGTGLDEILGPTELLSSDRRGIYPLTNSMSHLDARGAFVAESVKFDLDELRRSVATATYSALNRIQDFVSEYLTAPWPENPSLRAGFRLEELGVRWSGSDLCMWFGDAADPVLTLPSISESELGLSRG